MQTVNFYSVIIGTELLNGRRKDAHFAFLNEELLKRGWNHKASFVIDDDPKFMLEIFKLIKSDENSVMFCYGGIGATPDDFTREVAADAFTNSNMEFNEKAKELILDRFGDEAYPHRINMSYIPIKAKLLKNVVNNVAGFSLDNRFFFTPGFPSMSQSMVLEALDTYYVKNETKRYRYTLRASCGENDLIDLMKKVPNDIELSSLPRILGDKREVEISLCCEDDLKVKEVFKDFEDYLKENAIEFIYSDE